MDDATNPIVIIDSGIGGLNIVKHIKDKLPNENIVFLADQKFVPYGDMPIKEIRPRMKYLMNEAIKHEPKAIIIGCNTVDALFDSYIDTTNEKIIHIIEPTMKYALEQQTKGKVLILGTTRTIESQAYAKHAISARGHLEIIGLDCSGLANLIEKNDNPTTLLKSLSSQVKDEKFEVVVIGCTHYSSIIKDIEKAFPIEKIVDSSLVAANKVITYLASRKLQNKHHHGDLFLTTGDCAVFSDQLSALKLTGKIDVF